MAQSRASRYSGDRAASKTQQFTVSGMRDVSWPHCGIFTAAGHEELPDLLALANYPQARSQKQLQAITQTLVPLAQTRPLIRWQMLEEVIVGENTENRKHAPGAHIFPLQRSRKFS